MQVSVRPKAWAIVATAAVALAALGGCSSSKSTGSNGPSSQSNTGSSSSTGGSAAAEVTAAKNEVAPYLQIPTTINQTVPLTGKIPTDKPWVIITCELPQCQTISDGALAAAKAAGVPTKLLSYKTTDGTTLTTAMQSALTYKPIAVSPVGFTQAVWNNLQSAYKAANVSITPIAVGDVSQSDVVTTGAASQLDYTASGKVMANYVIADSNAAAHVLVFDVPAFAVLKAFGDGFKSQIASACSGCKVTDLDISPAQLAGGSVASSIVAALQKDKSIKYLVATDGAFLTGISTALSAGGLSGIKILGGSPDVNNLTAVGAGTQTAFVAAAESEYGWIALDIIARKALGMTIPPGDGGRVTAILTKSNVGTPQAAGWNAPADYASQYEKLWGVS